MAQHNNYAKDRDLMMEAYASVSGYVPRTSTTALPRGYVLTESNCSDEEDTIDSIKLGGKLYEVGNDDPNDDGLIIDIEKRANGYFITGGVYSEPEDFVNDPGKPKEGYGYALDLDGNPMEADDLEGGNPTAPKEDGEDADFDAEQSDADPFRNDGKSDFDAEQSDADPYRHSENNEHEAKFANIAQDISNGVGLDELKTIYGKEAVAAYIIDGEAKGKFEGSMEDNEQSEGATNEFPDGEGKYEVASVGGMHGQSIMRGKRFNSLADACAHAGCDPSEITSDGWIDMEGDGTTLEFMVDEDTAIVMYR